MQRLCWNFPSIALTVCQARTLFCGAGLVREVHFGDGMARYEKERDNRHHGHLLCVHSHKEVEISNQDIEKV